MKLLADRFVDKVVTIPIMTVGVIAISCSFSINSASAITLLGSRAALNANDSLDWSAFGNPPIATVPSGSTRATVGGLNVTVALPSGSLETRKQCPSTGACGIGIFAGNFAPNDNLLGTYTNSGPLTLTFSSPVFGAGLQIMTYNYGSGTFSGTVQGFNSSNQNLGSFSFTGNANANADNSALFVGLLSSQQDLSKLVVNVPNFPGPQFMVNLLSVNVPWETHSIAGTLGFGMWAAWLGWRRSRAMKKVE